ncbi:unnamed protein product [Symbiodinium pilosum]|uniref:Uncharacterized protein n=1 Tax=Symbiodinium pilosum TaxID=2952 RepID=A0A812MBR2_SYMPI|nr:unnamed protein product [Symbiodinium pilosum]
MSAGNPIPCITDITDLNSGQAFLIIDVPGAREFVLKLDSSICDEDGQGGQISAPVNMYKLCAEVVIPRTVVKEQLCRISSGEEMRELVASLSSEADTWSICRSDDDDDDDDS